MPCCGDIVHGAAGLAKAALRIDRAPEAVIAVRRDVCRECDRAEWRARKDGSTGLTTFSRCGECRCFIAAKSAVDAELCPLGKWPARPTAYD